MRKSGQRQSARFQEGASVHLHEELPVGVVVIRHRCLRRGGQPAQNHADAGLGESLAMLGARRAEGPLDTIIAVTAASLTHVVGVEVIGIADGNFPYHPTSRCPLVPQGQPRQVAREATRAGGRCVLGVQTSLPYGR